MSAGPLGGVVCVRQPDRPFSVRVLLIGEGLAASAELSALSAAVLDVEQIKVRPDLGLEALALFLVTPGAEESSLPEEAGRLLNTMETADLVVIACDGEPKSTETTRLLDGLGATLGIDTLLVPTSSGRFDAFRPYGTVVSPHASGDEKEWGTVVSAILSSAFVPGFVTIDWHDVRSMLREGTAMHWSCIAAEDARTALERLPEVFELQTRDAASPRRGLAVISQDASFRLKDLTRALGRMRMANTAHLLFATPETPGPGAILLLGY